MGAKDSKAELMQNQTETKLMRIHTEEHEYKVGETFRLKVKSSGNKVKWRFNEKELATASGMSFVKSNANFQDSGKYECIIDDRSTHVFEIKIYKDIILTQTEEHEYEFGKTIRLEVKTRSEDKKVKWRFNGRILFTTNLQFEKSDAKLQDSGKYECIIDDRLTYVFNVKIYDFLFGNKFLGIRRSIIDKPTEERRGVKSFTKNANLKTIEKTSTPVSTPVTESEHKLKEYHMGRNPRGIAVIIVIDEFDITEMNLKGMKTNDTAKLKETFQKLHFKVMECPKTKADDIITYLQEVANRNHTPYDCFVLCFSTHGGNGFVCCSDFKRNYEDQTEKGFILLTKLLEPFLSDKCESLKGKPKLFFLDCCRTIDKTLDIGKHQSPIRVFDSEEEESVHYADILIGYATVAGSTTILADSGGSCYTEILTKCLNSHIANESLADVMVEVSNRMQKEFKLTAHHESTLTGKIVMEN